MKKKTPIMKNSLYQILHKARQLKKICDITTCSQKNQEVKQNGKCDNKAATLDPKEDKNDRDKPDTVTYRINVRKPGKFQLRISSSEDTKPNINVVITVPQPAEGMITDSKNKEAKNDPTEGPQSTDQAEISNCHTKTHERDSAHGSMAEWRAL